MTQSTKFIMTLLYLVYNEFLYRPLFNGLIFIYGFLPGHDLGITIVIFTLLLRIILTPLIWKSQIAQKSMASLQPEIKRIQESFRENKEAQGKMLMELYAKNKVNPLSGCLMLLVQIPVLLAIFHIFQNGFEVKELKNLYSFISNPGVINSISLGFLDLSKGNIWLGIPAAVLQYFQTKISMPQASGMGQGGDFSKMLRLQSLYFFPAIILVWSYTLPSALTLYWTVFSLFGILQEIIFKKYKIQK